VAVDFGAGRAAIFLQKFADWCKAGCVGVTYAPPPTCPACGAALLSTDGTGRFECPRARCGRLTDVHEVAR